MSHRDEYANACRDPIRVEVQQPKAHLPPGEGPALSLSKGNQPNFSANQVSRQRQCGLPPRPFACKPRQTARFCRLISRPERDGTCFGGHGRQRDAVTSGIAIPVVQIVMCVEPPRRWRRDMVGYRGTRGHRSSQTAMKPLVHYAHSPASKLRLTLVAVRSAAIPAQMTDWSLQPKRTLRFEIHGQHGLTPRLPEHGLP